MSVMISEAILKAINRTLPERSGLLLFGSRQAGTFDNFSDVDLIAISDVSQPYRQRAPVDGIVLDLHVHSEKSLLRALQAQTRSSQWFYTGAFSSGEILEDTNRFLGKLKVNAKKFATGKPCKINLVIYRFTLATLISDLKRDVDRCVGSLKGNKAYSTLLTYFSLTNRGWAASPVIMRNWLMQDNHELSEKLNAAYLLALDGKLRALREIAEQVLEQIGGELDVQEQLPMNY